MSRDEHSTDQSFLNIAAYTARTQALGPGVRAVIWVQGCPFHCRGCIAPDWIPFVPASRFTPEEILEKIDLNQIDGLTFSGGEPMAQASGLAKVAKLAKRKKALNIISFTGYRYEQLISTPPNPGVIELLSEIDVLIDGPYIGSKNDSMGLRGSSNQRILHLKQTLKNSGLESQVRKMEVRISDGEVSFIGIPTPTFKTAVDAAAFLK